MQLVAYGAQDVYLTGNPQITFFKVVYRRHTNFSCEAIEQTFNGSADFGRKVTCTVSRNGDLMGSVYLVAVLPAVAATSGSKVAWCKNVGNALIKNVEVEIGGSRIDKHYGDWLNVWSDLTVCADKRAAYDQMIGNTAGLTTMAASLAETTLYVPLQFWFCRNTGLALPLIALQYHEVRFNIEFESAANLLHRNTAGDSSGLALQDAFLLVEYVYLDSEERKRFAQAAHEYLIEQVQFTGDESISNTSHKIKLNFNHPVKELVWCARQTSQTSGVYIANNVDDLAKQVVKATMSATGTGAIPESWVVADDNGTAYVHLTDNALVVGGANLLDLIDSAVVDIVGSTVTVVSVSHRLTSAHLQPLSSYTLASGDAATSDDVDTVTIRNCSSYGVYADGSGNPTTAALLQLNGHDRFDQRNGDYFNFVQPYQHHTSTPSAGVNVYSFALNPEEHQPSGTCNMSRIDNATLNLTVDSAFGTGVAKIYAVNYNVLRIMSGMGGLAYSN